MDEKQLIAETEIGIRFNEVDALGIVWHGNYVKYFEDGREAFGEKFDLPRRSPCGKPPTIFLTPRDLQVRGRLPGSRD